MRVQTICIDFVIQNGLLMRRPLREIIYNNFPLQKKILVFETPPPLPGFYGPVLPSYIVILSDDQDSLSSTTCVWERGNQFTIKLQVFKKKCLYFNVGNKFVSFKSRKYYFQA